MVLRGNLNRWFYTFCCFGLMSMVYMTYRINSTPSMASTGSMSSSHTGGDPQKSHLLIDDKHKPAQKTLPKISQPAKDYVDPSQMVVENRAFIILNPTKFTSYHPIVVAMLHLRYKFKTLKYSGNPIDPLHSSPTRGMYSVVVFQDIHVYMTMNYDDRERVESYCRKFHVGMIIFSEPQQYGDLRFNKTILSLPLSYSSGMRLQTYAVSDSPIADIARTNFKLDVHNLREWFVFHPRHNSYKTISYGAKTGSEAKLITAVLDPGEVDGVQRVFFGHSHHIWPHKILYLDALAYITRQSMKMEKTKYLQIDIDDMFIGVNGTKMTTLDVEALVKAQAVWSKYYVPGFKFFIGISGKFFKRGLPEEQEGDERIISQEVVNEFRWFDHTFSHIQAHKFTDVNDIIREFQKNKAFALEHNIPIDPTYTVAPHHSGVYPVHEQLYRAWKTVWNISVTSTEEYPHLKQQYARKGFIHSGVQVLPRQICGLYTKNLKYDDYPGGPARLENNIFGGELFDTILYNYVNVYMTHQQNYGNDRLAIYTFDKVFQLFRNATTLQLRGAHPTKMAELYFKKYKSDKDPVWLNPCSDKKHFEIWNEEKNCNKLPSLLIVGPQKTGTTALYTYLKSHPSITANTDSPISYEEVQFFGNKNYANGIEWYMDYFPDQGFSFEKSATYFDSDVVPKQAYSLLPDAKIIIMLLNPLDRALSWYYHQREHNDQTALDNSFYDVIVNSEKSNRAVQGLKTHMIKPGFYYDHIQKWRQYYPDNQILFVDGDKFKQDPVPVLSQIQKFLKLADVVDYSKILQYDEKKGFYCLRTTGGKSQCLGGGKGRSRNYGSMDEKSRAYLQQVFATPNSYLKQLLTSLKYPLPDWLKGS